MANGGTGEDSPVSVSEQSLSAARFSSWNVSIWQGLSQLCIERWGRGSLSICTATHCQFSKIVIIKVFVRRYAVVRWHTDCLYVVAYYDVVQEGYSVCAYHPRYAMNGECLLVFFCFETVQDGSSVRVCGG
jgi:hypothetical protein